MGRARVSPVVPTVWLVIDGSNSMNELLSREEGTRWKTLRSAVLDQGGIVPELQANARFGMVIYSGPLRPQCNPMAHRDRACGCNLGYEDVCCTSACGAEDTGDVNYCEAQLEVVAPATSNGSAIAASYPAGPIGGWTPTDRALEHVVQQLPAELASDPGSPIYVVLATDGAPNDICSQFDGDSAKAEVEQRALAAVQSGVQQGMRLFVISLAGEDMELRTHLEKVGAAAKPPVEPLVPASKQQLIDTLRQIVGGATCQVSLDGEVMMGQECEGLVQLNGTALECNAEHGWKLLDASTIALTGDACTSFLQMESTVTADFPCNVFIPQ
jgi:hypothetical protein